MLLLLLLLPTPCRHVFTDLLDEDTLVFVFGDHGMTSTGDHGGETDLETNAALLVYSPRPLFDPQEVCVCTYMCVWMGGCEREWHLQFHSLASHRT